LAARGAGILDRHEEALADGSAVASEIVNDGWREKLGHATVPRITAEAAGVNLARISDAADLTLYAHYATDTAGHEERLDVAIESLVRVDAFLRGLLSELASDTLLLVASDHGNIEDVRGGHTRNPVLGIAAGPGSGRAATMTDIREVPAFILDMLARR
jgi:phosphopentomutase